MSKIHGQASIRINGQYYESDNDASLKPGGIKNNNRMIGRKSFYNQTTIPSEVKCKIGVTKDISLTALQSISEAEVTFTSDTGRTWIIRNAAQTGELEMSGGDSGGSVELTLQGEPAEEMV